MEIDAVLPHRAKPSSLRLGIAPPACDLSAIGRIRDHRKGSDHWNLPARLFFWFKATFSQRSERGKRFYRLGSTCTIRERSGTSGLLAADRLSEEPEAHLPEAPHAGLTAGYLVARKQVAPTVAALANTRRREWTGRVEKQIARMAAYYAQLRGEADERATRVTDPARAAARRDAIDREERLRVAELRQKSAVHVLFKLASMSIVQLPKLLISGAFSEKNRPIGRLESVWDPLSEAIEAIPCPGCGQLTFELRIDRNGLACANCAGRLPRKMNIGGQAHRTV